MCASTVGGSGNQQVQFGILGTQRSSAPTRLGLGPFPHLTALEDLKRHAEKRKHQQKPPHTPMRHGQMGHFGRSCAKALTAGYF